MQERAKVAAAPGLIFVLKRSSPSAASQEAGATLGSSPSNAIRGPTVPSRESFAVLKPLRLFFGLAKRCRGRAAGTDSQGPLEEPVVGVTLGRPPVRARKTPFQTFFLAKAEP